MPLTFQVKGKEEYTHNSMTQGLPKQDKLTQIVWQNFVCIDSDSVAKLCVH